MKYFFKFTQFALFLVIYFICSSNCQLTITSQSNPIINQSSNYTFQANRADSTPIDFIDITFPVGFNITAINSSPFTFTIIGQTVTFTVAASKTNISISVSIENVINPNISQSLVGQISMTLRDSTTYSYLLNTSNGNIVPENLTCEIKFLNYTNTLGMADITIYTKSKIPAGSNTLGIQYTNSWISNPNGTKLSKNLVSRNGSYNLNITINIISPKTLQLGTTPTLSINNTAIYFNVIATSDIAANTKIQFYLQNVNMPPMQKILDQLSVSTGNTNLNFYDQNVCIIQQTTPIYTIVGLFQTFTNNSVNSVNTNAIIDFANFQDIQIAQNDLLLVTYPDQNYTQNSYILKGNTNGQNINCYLNDTNNNVQTFVDNFTNNLTIAAPNQAFSLLFQDILRLPSTIAPVAFNFTFQRQLNPYLQATVFLSAASGPINNISFTANPSTLSNNSTYNLTFTPNDPITGAGGIVIFFPTAINPSNAKVTAKGLNISSGPKVVYTSSNNFLTISNIFIVSCVANTTIELTISNVTNPTTVPYGNITITTYNDITDNTSIIDTGTFFPTFTPNLIQNGTLVINNLTVGATTIYTMSYQNMINLPAVVTFCVIIPSNVTYNNVSNPKISINNNSPLSYSSSFINNNITIVINFGSPIANQSKISIALNITNPNNTMTLGAFNIYEYQAGFQLQNAVFYGNITIPAQFTSFAITLINFTTTGSNNLYGFSFKTSIDHPVGSVFNVTLPPQILYYNNITCIKTILDCTVATFNSQSIFIVINTILLSGQTYNFSLDNICNPRSLKPSSNFIITTSNSFGQINICNGLSVTASTASPMLISFFTNISYQYYYQSNSSIALIINTITNPLISTDCLLVEFDKTFYTRNPNISSSSCLQNQYNCSDYFANPLTTIICLKSGNTWNIPTTIIISGYVTGSNFYPTNGIIIISIDNALYPIDQSNSLLFTPTCDMTSAFCQTCSLSNISFCFTCYSNTTITNQLYFFNNTCTNNCAQLTQYYYYTSAKCEACISPCYTCSNSTVCLSCINSTYLYANSSCLSTCNTSNNFCVLNQTINLVTYIKCLSCNSSCIGCSAVNYCLKCANPAYFLQDGFCVTSCSSTFYLNSTQCLPCYNTCGSCTGSSIFQCTTCINTAYFMTSNNACVATCPNTTVANLITQKCQCYSNCSTCFGLETNCTSCISNYYVNNGICVNQCPNMTYINMGYCISCQLGCINCTIAGCLVCDVNFYLFNGSCYTSCNNIGQGYIIDQSNKLCLKCSVGCSICEASNLTICRTCLNGYVLSGTQCTIPINCAAGQKLKGNICIIDQSLYGKIYLAALSCAVVAILTFGIVSKIMNKKIFLPYSVMPFLSVIEIIACITLILFAQLLPRRLLIFENILFDMNIYSIGNKLIMASIIINYFLNFIHICVYCKYLVQDEMFIKNHQTISHKCWSIILFIIATLTNFKFYQVIFSKICHIELFSTKLSSVKEFKPLHILNAFSLIGSGTGIFGASLIFSGSSAEQSQLLAGIACIVVIAINIIFVLLSFVKNDYFFQDNQNYNKRQETLEDMVVSAKDQKNLKNQTKLESFSKLLEFQQDHGQQLLHNNKINQSNPQVLVPVQRSRRKDASQIDYISSIGNNDKKDIHLDYDSSMDIPINQKTNKTRYKVRTSKVPLKQKKLPEEMLQIRENNNEIQEEKVDTIINELQSQIHEDGNKNLVDTIQNNQSLIIMSTEDINKQQQKHTKNLLTEHFEQKQRSQNAPQRTLDQVNDNSIIIKVKQRDKMKSVRHVGDLMKMTPTNEEFLTQNFNPPQDNIDMDFIQRFYHNDNNKQFTQPEAEYNEVSPSYFNIANQRFQVQDFIQNSELSSSSNFNKNGKKTHEVSEIKEFDAKNLKPDS